MARTILNAGMLDLLREVVVAVQKKRSYLHHPFWKRLLAESEAICLGQREVSPERLEKIEKYILDGVREYGVSIRREPCGRSQSLASLERTRSLGFAAE